MASEAMNQTGSDEKIKISFRFCRECSNLLYPREDETTQKLLYACATCPYVVESDSSCVFRNELGNTVGETAGITQDVGSDPTVGDIPICTMCGQQILCERCGQAQSDSYVSLEVEDYMSDIEESRSVSSKSGSSRPQQTQQQRSSSHRESKT